jgi:hypothetical protein
LLDLLMHSVAQLELPDLAAAVQELVAERQRTSLAENQRKLRADEERQKMATHRG